MWEKGLCKCDSGKERRKIILDYLDRHNHCILGLFGFLRFYLFIFRERGREGEREGEEHHVWLPLECSLLGTWPTTQACALTRNRTGDPLVCKPVLNPLSPTSQSHWVLIRGRREGQGREGDLKWKPRSERRTGCEERRPDEPEAGKRQVSGLLPKASRRNTGLLALAFAQCNCAHISDRRDCK